MKFVFSAPERAIERLLEDIARQIDEARAGAVQDAAKLAVAEGQANVASAGFAGRERTVKSRFFKNKGGDPAALVFFSMPFVGVFERGATISGRPLLWLPIKKNLPAGVRSPRKYGRRLVSVNIAGKPPLLFDAANRKLGPLFFGTPSATIKKRLDLRRIFARAAERMQEFYEQRIKG